MKQTSTFQTLSDETRLRALLLMAGEGELCVCELMHALDLPQPKISRHLAAMRDSGIVVSRRHAQWVFYFINPELEHWQRQIVEATVAGAGDEPKTMKDRERLTTMPNRPERTFAA